MANALTNTGVMDPGRIELKSYRVTLPLESLSIGVDNIHHDVFLSPKFVQVARDYLEGRTPIPCARCNTEVKFKSSNSAW
jgi:hypothetical protein